MPTDSLQPMIVIAAILGFLIMVMFVILFTLRARSLSLEQQTASCLLQHQEYFQYLSIHMDSPDRLLPPPGKLTNKELKAIQQKLLEWIEVLEGSHRDKLCELCQQMGLVDLDRDRLHSHLHWERIDAVYHLGVMRAKSCTGELLSLLERETDESTAFVIGRAAAKCAQQPGELRRLILRLVKHHPQSHHLILDIIGSSDLDPVPVFLEMLLTQEEDLITVALVGLSGRNVPEAIPFLDNLVHSENKELRVKASKLLLQYTHLLLPDKLLAFMQHSDWEIRAAAVKIAGEQPAGDFIDILKHAMLDSEWWVRHHAIASLSKLGISGFQAICDAAIAAKEEPHRDMALDAIHEMMKSAEALAVQDIKQLLYFNECSHLYEKMFNESYVDRNETQLRISS
ncbi:HEAT repeat-containing protein [Paenibacillus sp. 1_12]|uniref:HEAT repeat domain-containing protein n=1 Tax=Paenibacillus sp. 1_12 TaxID=1566278 RepID=UPI0008DF6C65|nr:HEAT repeat domain-containing protein [Paenibacillus sp. 1_12]SFL72675.1 HEAT repeat-containing protein [Paenibacillus sp. 1_12]